MCVRMNVSQSELDVLWLNLVEISLLARLKVQFLYNLRKCRCFGTSRDLNLHTFSPAMTPPTKIVLLICDICKKTGRDNSSNSN